MLYLIYRTNSAPFVRAKDTSLHNNYNRYLPFHQGLFLICEKLSKIGHEDRRPLAKDGYPKDKPPDLSASRFEDQGACCMLLGALTSDLLQDTSDISIDADGFCSNFSGCIGFPQIDAGVGSPHSAPMRDTSPRPVQRCRHSADSWSWAFRTRGSGGPALWEGA